MVPCTAVSQETHQAPWPRRAFQPHQLPEAAAKSLLIRQLHILPLGRNVWKCLSVPAPACGRCNNFMALQVPVHEQSCFKGPRPQVLYKAAYSFPVQVLQDGLDFSPCSLYLATDAADQIIILLTQIVPPSTNSTSCTDYLDTTIHADSHTAISSNSTLSQIQIDSTTTSPSPCIKRSHMRNNSSYYSLHYIYIYTHIIYIYVHHREMSKSMPTPSLSIHRFIKITSHSRQPSSSRRHRRRLPCHQHPRR